LLAIGLIIGIPFLIWLIYRLLRTYDVIGGRHTEITVAPGKVIRSRKVKEKEDYKNRVWLKHHYHKLGWSIQDIANDQGVSMMTVKKWVEKLENDIP
jgi:hypothetical protein